MNTPPPGPTTGYMYIAHEGDMGLIMREIGTVLNENLLAEDSLRELSHLEGPRYKVTITVELA